MTTILAAEGDWGVTMWADSGIVAGGQPFKSTEMAKIVVRVPYMIAAAGSSWLCDHFQLSWEPPTLSEPTWAEMSRVFGPAVRAELTELGLDYAKQSDEWALQMLVAVHGHLFQVEYDGTILVEDTGVHAIGSGAQYALGAYAAQPDGVAAVMAACKYDINSAPPVLTRAQGRRP